MRTAAVLTVLALAAGCGGTDVTGELAASSARSAPATAAPEPTPEIYTHDGVDYQRRGEMWVRTDATWPIDEGDVLPAGPVSGRPLPEWTQADRDAADAEASPAGPTTDPSPDPEPDPEPDPSEPPAGPEPVPPPDPADHWRADPLSSSGPPGNLPGARPGSGGPVTGERPWTLTDLRWMDREYRYWRDHQEWGDDGPPTTRTEYARIADAIEAGNTPEWWYDLDCWAGWDELEESCSR